MQAVLLRIIYVTWFHILLWLLVVGQGSSLLVALLVSKTSMENIHKLLPLIIQIPHRCNNYNCVTN